MLLYPSISNKRQKVRWQLGSSQRQMVAWTEIYDVEFSSLQYHMQQVARISTLG
jgi:hypothetical protein